MIIAMRESISACRAVYARPTTSATNPTNDMRVARTILASPPTMTTKRITNNDARMTLRMSGTNTRTKSTKLMSIAILNPESTTMCESPATRNV